MNENWLENVRILRNSDALPILSLGVFKATIHQCVNEYGRAIVALSGGSTPEILYRQLAAASQSEDAEILRRRIATECNVIGFSWQRIHAYFGDERFVPPDDPQSNYGMARRALLDHVPIPPGQIYPMPTVGLEPDEAAAQYQRTMREHCPLNDEGIPVLDCILLGMGADGHTASLFPYTPALSARDSDVAAVWVEKLNAYRITLTPRVLQAARQVIVLVTGREKAAVLKEVLCGPEDLQRLPIQLLRRAQGGVCWLVDEEAAAELPKNLDE